MRRVILLSAFYFLLGLTLANAAGVIAFFRKHLAESH